MPSAIYAGSFDPPTVGHVNIFLQACEIFEHISILVATHPTKAPMFTAEDRVRIWEEIISAHDLYFPDAQILPSDEYTAQWAVDRFYTHLIRGLRSGSDLEDEIIIYDLNRMIEPSIRTVYFMTTPNLRAISSSAVKALIGPQGWEDKIKDLIPSASLNALMRIHQ